MRRKKKKNNALQKFIRVFAKSILIIAALLLAGFISYKGSLLYFDQFGGPKDDKAAKLINELYGEVKVTDVPINLIYAMSEDKQIKAVVLEIFNTNTSNMDYITVPLKAKFTLSNELYQKLCSSGSDAPQIMKLSKMDDYFNDTVLYEYGVILLEDLLDIDINYYTAVPVELFKKMFKQRKAAEVFAEDGTPMQSYYEWKIRETYKKEISGLTGNELEKYVRNQTEACKSNLNMRSKLEYVKDYEKINKNYIYTHSIYGRLEGLDFEVNVEASNQLIRKILANPSYTEAQKNAKTAEIPKASLGYTIEILNGSQITGLAAGYQSKLLEDGYTVSSIGNYQGDIVAQTKILVSREALGTDLLSYFKNALVEKTDTLTNCDIQIILGTDADIGGN